jgi:hypothetical protein
MVGHSFIGQPLVRRARLEPIVQHLEFSGEIVDQRSGRFRFPSGNVCLADRPECRGSAARASTMRGTDIDTLTSSS